MRAIGIAFSIGGPFAVLVSSGALGGWFLDRKFGSWPWLSLVGSVLGLGASLVNALRVSSVMERTERAAGKRPPDREGD